ncbi:MAG: YciI family protein [Geminicoccaceae bacterium]
MPWLISFEDEPTRAHVRAEFLPKHLDYVRSIERSLLCAGPLREAADGPQTGGLWIVDGEDRARAVALFEADPFFTEGLRANVRVQYWGKGVWDGKLL